jgi:hypothetical protein
LFKDSPTTFVNCCQYPNFLLLVGFPEALESIDHETVFKCKIKVFRPALTYEFTAWSYEWNTFLNFLNPRAFT